ncbi:hypothetical protein GGE07_005791 [Sinorhizobium terangae]|nr:hypothetical protein [Sinorhizobium terangae]
MQISYTTKHMVEDRHFQLARQRFGMASNKLISRWALQIGQESLKYTERSSRGE